MPVYLVSLLILILDQASKLLALSHLPYGQTQAVLPGVFHLTLVRNTGVAFGMLSNLGAQLLLLVLPCLAAIIFLMYKSRGESVAVRLCLASIFGGAVGNLLDRVRLGYVVDFLDFRIWPVFNLADSFITAGVAVLVLFMLRREKK